MALRAGDPLLADVRPTPSPVPPQRTLAPESENGAGTAPRAGGLEAALSSGIHVRVKGVEKLGEGEERRFGGAGGLFLTWHDANAQPPSPAGAGAFITWVPRDGQQSPRSYRLVDILSIASNDLLGNVVIVARRPGQERQQDTLALVIDDFAVSAARLESLLRSHSRLVRARAARAPPRIVQAPRAGRHVPHAGQSAYGGRRDANVPPDALRPYCDAVRLPVVARARRASPPAADAPAQGGSDGEATATVRERRRDAAEAGASATGAAPRGATDGDGDGPRVEVGGDAAEETVFRAAAVCDPEVGTVLAIEVGDGRASLRRRRSSRGTSDGSGASSERVDRFSLGRHSSAELEDFDEAFGSGRPASDGSIGSLGRASSLRLDQEIPLDLKKAVEQTGAPPVEGPARVVERRLQRSNTAGWMIRPKPKKLADRPTPRSSVDGASGGAAAAGSATGTSAGGS